MGEAPVILQLVVGPIAELGHGVLGEELRDCLLGGDLPSGSLGAVLAELERMWFSRLCPGAAHAHEAIGLVLFPEDLAAEQQHLFLGENTADGPDRAPAASWS